MDRDPASPRNKADNQIRRSGLAAFGQHREQLVDANNQYIFCRRVRSFSFRWHQRALHASRASRALWQRLAFRTQSLVQLTAVDVAPADYRKKCVKLNEIESS